MKQVILLPIIAKWSAAKKLYNNDHRTILSYKPVQHEKIEFEWDFLDVNTQQNALNRDENGIDDEKGKYRVQFLRGKGVGTGANRDDALISNNNFRPRPSVLGDIIQSDPVYVGKPSFRYDEYNCTEGCSAYSTFKSSSRSPMVYVGANDGMLHGFNADTGDEKMAYIPGSLIDRLIPNSSTYKLNFLTSRNYAHQYYVEGSATDGRCLH